MSPSTRELEYILSGVGDDENHNPREYKKTKLIFKLGHSFGNPSKWGLCLLAKNILRNPSIFIWLLLTE